jgi:BASS family bile acid:Na+ symporter
MKVRGSMKNTRTYIINIGIFAAIFLGILFPAPLWEKKTLPFILGLLLVSNFMRIDFHLKKFFRKELLYFPMIGFIVIPTVIYFGTITLPLDLRLGLFLIAITPSAIASTVVVNLIGGDRELSVAHVLVSNMLAPFAYAGLLYLFFRADSVDIPVGSLLKDIITLLAVPFIISRVLLIHKKVQSMTERFFTWFNPVGFLLVIFVAVASSSQQLRAIQPELLALILALAALVAFVSFAIGFSLSRDSRIRRTLAVGFGHKNTSLAIWVAVSNFNPAVVLPMVSYLIFHHVINGILVHRYHR